MAPFVNTRKRLSAYSPRAKHTFAYAGDEAFRGTTGTEHLLLGLLRDEDILASRIMLNLGLSLAKMRQLLKKNGLQ